MSILRKNYFCPLTTYVHENMRRESHRERESLSRAKKTEAVVNAWRVWDTEQKFFKKERGAQ